MPWVCRGCLPMLQLPIKPGCRIQGAADASIREPQPNLFAPLLAKTRIDTIFTTGRTATALFNRLAADEAGMRSAYLPSTSPAARAAQSSPEFARLWGNIGRMLRGELVSAAGMKAADSHTIRALGIPSLTLMERAAQACVNELLAGGGAGGDTGGSGSAVSVGGAESAGGDTGGSGADAGSEGNGSGGRLTHHRFDLSRVLCVCGTGNNGGDGLAVARLLHAKGIAAAALVIGDTKRLTPDAAQQLAWAKGSGVPVSFNDISAIVGNVANWDADGTASPTTLVDALFGIGLARPLAGLPKQAVRAINKARGQNTSILAIDIPSGINANSGETLGTAVKADVTVTFARNKLGLTFGDGRGCAGLIRVANIGIVVG